MDILEFKNRNKKVPKEDRFKKGSNVKFKNLKKYGDFGKKRIAKGSLESDTGEQTVKINVDGTVYEVDRVDAELIPEASCGIFQFIDHLTVNKTKWEELRKEDQKGFEPYIVNRWLSMNPSFLPAVSAMQVYTLGQMTKEQVYKLYLSFLPQQKQFISWIKGKNENKIDKILLDALCVYYEESSTKIKEYYGLISEQDKIFALKRCGYDEGEIKKILNNK